MGGSFMAENTKQTQQISDEEKAKLLNSSIRALISLAPNSEEADKVVKNFKKDLPKDDLECFQEKYKYVTSLFNIDANARKSCIKTDATELDKIKSDYFSLLSILILKRWQ
jgi:hypothetical protein